MAINWQALLGINQLRESARFWVEEGSIAISDRTELAKIEWASYQKSLIQTLIAAVLLVYFLFGFLFLGSIIILLHWWQTPGWGNALAVVLIGWGAFSAIGLGLLLSCRKRLANPFLLTRQVLAADYQELKERL